MRFRAACWVAVGLSLGSMVLITTYFQLALPRPRTAWISAGIAQHNTIMQGRAGDPWQYRVLSDHLLAGLLDAFALAHKQSSYQSDLFAFVLFRGAQEVCIFALGFVYFRKLGLGLTSSVVGLAVVCLAMLLGQVETNWRLDTYTETILYLAAGLLVVSRRFVLIVPLAAVAALNRETGVLIPLMPLALVDVSVLTSRQNLAIYRSVCFGVLLFFIVLIALHLGLPSQDSSTRVVTDEVIGNIKIRGLYVFLAIGLAGVPLIGALGLRACGRIPRYLFWLVMPAWVVTHAWGNLAMTPLAFIVPLVLVLAPNALLMLRAVWSRSATIFESGVKHDLAAHWETAAALGVVSVLGPIMAGVVRLGYPFPLERFEGPMLQEVRRVALGLPLYVAPSLDYVPLLYGPLYVYASAAVATLTGVSLLPLRMVSLTAALGSAFLVYLLVSRDAPGRLPGMLAAGLFLGATQLTPTDRYPARVDALCLVLLLAAIFAARRADDQPGSAPRLSAVSGLLIGLAILTKQTAAVVLLPLLVLGLARVRARVLPYVAAAGLTLLGGWLAIIAASDGWARFYLFEMPRNHDLEWSMVIGFWTDYILPHFGLALLFAPVFFVVRIPRRDFVTVRFYALVASALIGMGWLAILNPGGRTNSLPPTYAALAMLFGLGFQASLNVAQERCPLSRTLPTGLFTIAALSLATLGYSKDQPAPLRANARAGQRLVDAIACLPGAVYAPELGEFAVRAGKPDQAFTASRQDWQQLLATYGGPMPAAARTFQAELDQALSDRRFSYVLLDSEGFDPKLKATVNYHGYAATGPLFDGSDPFFQWRLGLSSGGGHLTPSPDVYAAGSSPARPAICADEPTGAGDPGVRE